MKKENISQFYKHTDTEKISETTENQKMDTLMFSHENLVVTILQ